MAEPPGYGPSEGASQPARPEGGLCRATGTREWIWGVVKKETRAHFGVYHRYSTMPEELSFFQAPLSVGPVKSLFIVIFCVFGFFFCFYYESGHLSLTLIHFGNLASSHKDSCGLGR